MESGLRKQRDNLQIQLDKAAQREAMLEARLGELEEKLLLEDSVWSELALDPRITPEAMALKLRRAKEMQAWAQRAEEDERRARIAAEERLKQLEQERDAAQEALMRANAKLADLSRPTSILQEVRQRRSQPAAAGSPPQGNAAQASTQDDVSPLVSMEVLKIDAREQGRQLLHAAMNDAYQRAGIDAGMVRADAGTDRARFAARAVEMSCSPAPAAAVAGGGGGGGGGRASSAQVVEMNLRLNTDFQTAGQEGSTQRQIFINDLKQDLAHASGICVCVCACVCVCVSVCTHTYVYTYIHPSIQHTYN